ncbi:MAG: murein biosynthesis integral membrane protein MurJ [Alcaligenaceae bacterium]|nr:murein biosynthesis integral membrane protein MurJ [Alcaligenaceae bacterium]
MSLLRSAATISGLTLLSRITGLARDILIARTFGASPLTDAFWVAFRIPNLLRRLFAEGAFSQAFVPILGEARNKNPEEKVKILLDHVATILTFALMTVTLLGVVATPWIVTLMASGMSKPENQTAFDAAVWMTRVMFPYILCMSLVAFASGVLNTWRNFAVPAFTPVLLNISMILASLFLTGYFSTPIYALAVGVMAGGIAQLAIQWLALGKLGLIPRITPKIRQAWQDPVVRRIIKQMGPAILGVSVAQISILINTNIATWLTAGSVTWLSFADRLMEFPTALLGIALGTVLLPSLSAAHAKEDSQAYNSLMDWGLKLVFLLGMPAALGLAFLSDGLVATLFNYGAFGSDDVFYTRSAVMAYSVGLIGILSVKILAPGFYAKQDIRTPVKIAIFVLVCTQLLNIVFVPLIDHAGLALSIGLGATINALCLYIGLRRKKIYTPQGNWLRFFIRIAPALICMVAWLLFIQQYINWTSAIPGTINYAINNALSGIIGSAAFSISRMATLFLVLAGCGIIYFTVLLICGFRARDFTRRNK